MNKNIKKTTMLISSPEFVGEFPIRQDITVLPACGPKKLKAGWKLYEGSEVKDAKGNEILTHFSDIKKGTIVTVEDCFGNIRRAKCDSKKKDRPSYAYDTKWKYAYYTLSYNADDRHCWVCINTSHMSKSFLKRMTK